MALSSEKIRESIKALLELQTIDGEIFRLKSEEKNPPPDVATLKVKIEEARRAHRAADKAFKDIDRERRSLELRSLTMQEDLKRTEARKRDLRGSKEEFGATKDYESAQRKVHEVTKSLEEKQKLTADRQAALDAVVKKIEAFQVEAAAADESEKSRIAGIQKTIADLDSKRAAHISSVDEEVFSIYERVQRIRRGNGIAIVKDLLCGGCFVSIPPQLAIRLDKMEEILTCPSCSRILCPEDVLGGEAPVQATA